MIILFYILAINLLMIGKDKLSQAGNLGIFVNTEDGTV